MGLKFFGGCLIVAVVAAGCGSKPTPPAPKRPELSLGSITFPTTKPQAHPTSPIDQYAQKVEALQGRDGALAERVAKILANVDVQHASAPALKDAGEALGPLVVEAREMAKAYKDLDAPDQLQYFREAIRGSEAAMADSLEGLRAATSNEPAYTAAIEDLRTKADTASREVLDALRKDGYNPDIWNTAHQLVAVSGGVRTGL